jgi:hypothetical protein
MILAGLFFSDPKEEGKFTPELLEIYKEAPDDGDFVILMSNV